MLFRFKVFVLFLGFCPTTSYSDISVYKDDSSAIIIVSKTILDADAEDFKSSLEQNLDATLIKVFLASDGGSVKAALAIGRMIHALELSVQVPEGKLCASSCALIFFGSVNRSSFGRVGIHRPYFQVGANDVPPTDGDIAEMYASVEAYLKEMGVPSTIFETMMLTTPENMKTFEGAEIFSIVPEIAPIKSERETMFRAQVYGLDTVTYRKTKLLAEQTCDQTSFQTDGTEDMVRKEVKKMSCIDALLWGVEPQMIEQYHKEVRQRCLLPPDVSINFLSYKAGILRQALEGSRPDEMELPWYGFQPFLDYQECVRNYFGR